MASTTAYHHAPTIFQSKLFKPVLVAEALAGIYWLLALNIRAQEIIPVWFDQEHWFTPVGRVLSDPYLLEGYMNPPWAAVALSPAALLPMQVGVLIQLCLYFAILAAVIVKFGGGIRHTLIALTSFMAFDTSLELNIDWLPTLGLLVPVQWSLPFFMVKPQLLTGFYFSRRRPEWIRATIVGLIVFAVSLVIWGWWPTRMLHNMQRLLAEHHNMAPLSFMPAPISILIGIGLAVLAYRRRDALSGIAAGYFFVPYITLYSYLVFFSLVSARWPRIAVFISAVIWLVYGGTILLALLLR